MNVFYYHMSFNADILRIKPINKTMTTTKKLGIWMDHSTAHLMEYNDGIDGSNTIVSQFTHNDKMETLGRSENVMHNKEQHEQLAYYKKLGETILNYEEVLLFGPTDSKVELFNLLRVDHRFEKIKIELKPADKMTENQEQAFVKKHFSQH